MKKMRIMSERPLNAETPVEYLRSWITANKVFFDRNQGQIPKRAVLSRWRLAVEGAVEKPLSLRFEDIRKLPKAIVSNTLECSGNSRSLLKEKSRGNPWTVGGVGNAVWGGVQLRDVIEMAVPKERARFVAFEGFDTPLGSAQVHFVRSIPFDKAISSTLLAYEMNGEPLPVKHGFPLRALALGWTGANCVKWLSRITVMEKPYEGFFMDSVYRVFQKGQESTEGEPVTKIRLKSIITQPIAGEKLSSGTIVVLGAAYAGEDQVDQVEVSVDGGRNWDPAEFIGPFEPFAWRQWQYLWKAEKPGNTTLMARARNANNEYQPMHADWNVLGYGNSGISEHAVTVTVS